MIRDNGEGSIGGDGVSAARSSAPDFPFKTSAKPFIVGQTMMMDMKVPKAAVAKIVGAIEVPLAKDPAEKQPSSPPFKGTKMGGSLPTVDEGKWSGERESRRALLRVWPHITVVPFFEFGSLTAEQKEKLINTEIHAEVVMSEVFWSRGSAANAASGCKGMFYANLVLTAESITQIKAARESIGLPEAPKAPPQARNALDQDPRLHEFRFHFSVTAIMPPWAAEIDTFNILDASTAQEKMRSMCQRLDAWASQFRIVPDGEGNRLELVTPTDKPSSTA